MGPVNRGSRLAQSGLWMIVGVTVISLLTAPVYTPRAVAASGQSYSVGAALPAACPSDCYDIAGQVFIDNDGDGLYTSGTDSPLADVTLNLTGPVISTTVSNNRINNNYQFEALPSGVYTLTLDVATLPAGYEPVTPVELVVTLASADSWDNDFGVRLANTPTPGPTPTPTVTATQTDTPSPTPTHTPPADIGHDIVFVRPEPSPGGTTNSDIWIMNADGSNQTQLTTYAEEDQWPALSPDGSQIVYTARQGASLMLWVMNSDGTDPAQLPVSGNIQLATWSPDGTQLAYQSDAEDFWEVWVSNADGTNAQRLTTFAGASGSPSWSPDGQKLVFLNEPTFHFHDLYTINTDGTGLTLLSSSFTTGYSHHLPTWSSDGTQIATVRYPAGSFGPYDLWVMDADGTNGQVLVADIEAFEVNRISWTQDSNWIVFAKDDQVWRVMRDGSNLTQITTETGWQPQTNLVGFGSPIATPTVTPTSTSAPGLNPDIVFLRPQPAIDGSGSVNSEVWGMMADGSNQVQLTYNEGEDRWPALSPDESKIAYRSRQGGLITLWVMNSDGSNPVQLPIGGNSGSLDWSPDGSQIAFTNDSEDFWEIWAINADGSNLHRLTTTVGASGEPSWAPDGQALVFNSEPIAKYYDLYTVSSDGTNQTLLLSAAATGFSNLMSAWSPDGTQIATIHFPAGSAIGPYDLWLMDADGSNGHVLVQNVETPYTNHVSWSADGNWLVFGKDGQIWRVRRDGTELTQITFNSGWEPHTSTSGFGPSDTTPTATSTLTSVATPTSTPTVTPSGATPTPTATSQDSGSITFVRPQPNDSGTANSDIWIMGFDGSAQTQLTTYTGEDRHPALSPDGSKIAYMSRQSGLLTLWVMSSDGAGKVQLPVSGNIQSPIWSPDGTQITYQSDAEDFWEVWIVNADGTNPHRLTTTGAASGSSTWSPDGQKILFTNEPIARYQDLYVINVDGTGQTQLVSSFSTGYSHHRPTWSPDGSQIATLRYPVGTFGPNDLWLMDADGTNGYVLASGLEPPELNRISWSLDGNWLVFAMSGQVWRIRRDGTDLAQITFNDGWEPYTNAVTFPDVVRLFAPVIVGKPVPRGIYGRVTENGVAAPSVFLELRRYTGGVWSTQASQYTASDGSYSFTGVPSLNAGEYYYVRYQNSVSGPTNRLWTWHTQSLSSYTSGAEIQIGDFDIANIELITPASGAVVGLPYTFQWAARPATPLDSYEFNLFDYEDGDPYFFTDPPLGYVSSYTLNSLPPGFGTYTYYLWNMWVYSPDGGFGISYWSNWVAFSSSGFNITTTMESPSRAVRALDLPPLHPASELFNRQRPIGCE